MSKRIYQFFLIFILTACSQTEAPVDTGLITKTFHWGNGTEPQGIDPHIVTGVPEHHVLQSLCEGLKVLTQRVRKSPWSCPILDY